MNIKCPHCNQEYEFTPDLIGKTVQCTSCGNEFVGTNPNLISCPDCFGKISRRASVCPHCGAAFTPVRATAPAEVEDNTPEQEMFLGHPSSLYYLFSIIIGVLLIPAIVGIFIIIYCIIAINCTTYRITSRRVLVNTGLINKKQVEIWIKDMRGVNMERDLWQLIIGTGSVAIGTAATAGTEIKMHGLRNAQEIIDLINSLRK